MSVYPKLPALPRVFTARMPNSLALSHEPLGHHDVHGSFLIRISVRAVRLRLVGYLV